MFMDQSSMNFRTLKFYEFQNPTPKVLPILNQPNTQKMNQNSKFTKNLKASSLKTTKKLTHKKINSKKKIKITP